MLQLDNLYGIIPPIVTPVDENENVDEQGLKRVIDHVLDSGVHGVFVLGSNGEFYALDFAQTIQFIDATKDIENFKVLAGTDYYIFGTLMYCGCGAVAGTANVAPKLVSEIYDKFKSGDLEGALEAQMKLIPLRNTYSYGSFPVVMKDCLNLMGLNIGSPVRPISHCSPARMEALPDAAVKKALDGKNFGGGGKVLVVAIGKAAWNMASTAKSVLGDKVAKGLVVTKYDHIKGPIEGFEMIEAGHPIPDENSVLGAEKALDIVSELKKEDQVIFLISGGGSALFEQPLPGLTLEDIMDVTDQPMQ